MAQPAKAPMKISKPPGAGFHASVVIPPVGSHVRIVGALVKDTSHGQWNEIHPVTSITVIP